MTMNATAGLRDATSGRDHAAFAVTDQPDFLRVDFGPCPQVGDPRFGVRRKIDGGRRGEYAAGLADAPIVGAEDSDAATSQVIGQDQKRPMPQDRLVPILRA